MHGGGTPCALEAEAVIATNVKRNVISRARCRPVNFISFSSADLLS